MQCSSITLLCNVRQKVGNYFIVSLYLPCTGTVNRLLICEEILNEIWSWHEQYIECDWIIGGDFNVDLDTSDNIACVINSFRTRHSLVRCDDLFSRAKTATYVNEALHHQSCLDYMLVTSSAQVTDYDVIDPDINFSDHLPVVGSFNCVVSGKESNISDRERLAPVQLRWDHADLLSYYNFTRCSLEPILSRTKKVESQFNNTDINAESANFNDLIDQLHDDIITVLSTAAKLYVPHQRKNFYKFWWDQEMDILKTASVESNKIWKASGKPRQGPIFNKRQSCRLQYRKKIRENQSQASSSYSNDLHEALLKKNGTGFWKCWNSKFENRQKCNEVEGSVDVDVIVNKFADNFSTAYSPNDATRASSLYDEFIVLRSNYTVVFLFHQVTRLTLNCWATLLII